MTVIEARGLRKNYGPIEAVRGIDLAIEAGETVALLGPNGAGKSTTIDMLLGLAEPDGGSVSVLGGSPSGAIDAGEVGAMLQTGALIRDLSVTELIAMVASLYPAPLDVQETLRVTGLSDVAAQRTQKLSGGQTQRVRFAVALVSNPKLLVLDEPTVAMDVEGRRSFWTTMRAEAAQGRTILWCPHRGRASGRLEPPAAHQPALHARLFPRQGIDRLPDGATQHGRALRLGHLAWREHVRA